MDAFLKRVAIESLKSKRDRVRNRLNELLELELEEMRVKSWAMEY